MKYFNFKRNKFSTIFEKFNLKRYNFSRIFKFADFKRHNFSKIYKFMNFQRYNFRKISKFFEFKRYNYSKFLKHIKSIQYKNYLTYFFLISISLGFIYLIIPFFYNYGNQSIAEKICKTYNVECEVNGKISYSFFPTPRLEVKNVLIKNFVNKKENIGKVDNLTIKLSIYNLLDKTKFNIKKVELKSSEINLNSNEIGEYKKFIKNNFNNVPIYLLKSKINFFDEKKYITAIQDVYFKYNSKLNLDELTLKGSFVGDKIYINFKNKKKTNENSKIFILKLFNFDLLAKFNVTGKSQNKNILTGDIFFQKNKSKLTSFFEYFDNKIILKEGNLKNSLLKGKLDGELRFLDFFDFDLNLNLNIFNFNRLRNLLALLNKEDKKKLFKINKKINGNLNLSADKIISKHSLIKSFESRIRFFNGNILVEQVLLNLGKLGAADVAGIVKNDNKFSNFRFESNIYIDDLKYFSNKFGIYNREKIPYNLSISGNLDLLKFIFYLYEVIDENKFEKEEIAFLEKIFNETLLSDDYISLLDFANFKEFVKVVTGEVK